MENRVRFPKRVIERIRERIGDSMFIELRMNGTDRTPGGIVPENAAEQALMFGSSTLTVEITAKGFERLGPQ